MIVRMKYRKETKGTFVFEEVNKAGDQIDIAVAQIPSLYIRKSAMRKPAQYLRLELTVEA